MVMWEVEVEVEGQGRVEEDRDRREVSRTRVSAKVGAGEGRGRGGGVEVGSECVVLSTKRVFRMFSSESEVQVTSVEKMLHREGRGWDGWMALSGVGECVCVYYSILSGVETHT